ncbi:MAG: sugar phosphate isomerase/epimerase [Victivallales bacterium]|nr:sugar phosphate isomerase/epimerase [Victivallales bacterium]
MDTLFNAPLTFGTGEGIFPDSRARRFLFREAAFNGMQHIVLTESIVRAFLQDINKLDIYKKDLADMGLDFVDAHAPYGHLWDPGCLEPEYQRVLVANLRHVLELTALCGVKTITVHICSANVPPEVHPVEEYLEHAVKVLRQILPLAEELGIIVCIENIWRPTNYVDQLLEIKRQLPTDALGFCYDSGHANLTAKGMLDPENSCVTRDWNKAGYHDVKWETKTLEKMLPYIVNCHLHDNHGSRDEHNPPFDGNIDWAHVAFLLRKAPRLAAVQIEVSPAHHDVSCEHIINTCKKLSEL